jgi:aquaporin Z
VTHTSVSLPAAAGLEIGMTAVLMATILAAGRWAPLAIWPVIVVLTWQGSPFTGTSLNPARSEGPAVVFGDLAELWLYLAAPVVGAVAVARVTRLRAPRLRLRSPLIEKE